MDARRGRHTPENPWARIDVRSRLGPQQARAVLHSAFMCEGNVVDLEIEVDLLGDAVRPDRLNVIGRKLDGDQRPTFHADRVPFVRAIHNSVKQAGPECTLAFKVSGVEHHRSNPDVHCGSMARDAPPLIAREIDVRSSL